MPDSGGSTASARGVFLGQNLGFFAEMSYQTRQVFRSTKQFFPSVKDSGTVLDLQEFCKGSADSADRRQNSDKPK